jgi:alpha-glucuronidase
VRASRYLIALLLVAAACADAFAETGREAWLRYEPLTPAFRSSLKVPVPTAVVVAGDGDVLRNAAGELARGISAMTGRQVAVAAAAAGGGAVYVGRLDRIRAVVPLATPPAAVDPDGFWIGVTHPSGIAPSLVVAGGSDRGALYGAFALLREIAQGHDLSQLNRTEAPSAPQRWTNEWNNLDGSIERGYGGRSIFFRDNHVREDLALAGQYARLLASVGINACSVSNVNANPLLLTDPYGPELARLAAAFRPWGVRMAISVDFSSPKLIGGLDTFDPLDPRVAAFWKDRVDALYRAVPDLAGFVLKADSEGRLGPSAYGRTHADAANVIARALAPHQGVIFYRGFVYDHHMDWRNLKNDRARAAWDNFHDLDGKFDDNVILQIKHGPIDFQAREPVSPLFGALKATNQAIELQITQEYTGQQRHVVFLVPMWKEVLDFDLHADGPTPVSALVTGRHFRRPHGGFVGVSNVGESPTWLGADLAMANLYGFGRLAWNPSLAPERIADEWTRQTFGNDPQVVETTNSILLESWPAYERYTGPLGTQTLTDITGPHYGPGIESSENNGWGQWHRADAQGIGMDRTVATGTGYIGQYSPTVAAMYESEKTCPDDLLLFMHHVPYTHVLNSGKTVIQHFYDSHYQGAEEAADFVRRWRRLKSRVDDERHRRILAALEYQEGHAIVWRDAINSYFLKLSGIPDDKGRAGHFPGRYEAETMKLDGYTPADVTPWETAGGGKAVSCAGPGPCRASFTFDGSPGTYDVRVRYFDVNTGASSYALAVGTKTVDTWKADDHFPTKEPDGHSSTWHVVHGVTLSKGDAITVEATPDGGEHAPLDYVELVPSHEPMHP